MYLIRFFLCPFIKGNDDPQQTESKVLVQHFWLFSRPTHGKKKHFDFGTKRQKREERRCGSVRQHLGGMFFNVITEPQSPRLPTNTNPRCEYIKYCHSNRVTERNRHRRLFTIRAREPALEDGRRKHSGKEWGRLRGGRRRRSKGSYIA